MEKQLSMPRFAKSIIAPVIKQSSNLQDLIPQTLRTHCVSVRLNNAELQLLNTKRGSTSKGEWLRMASLQKLPTIVPPINVEAWKTLGEINQKLNRIALHIDSMKWSTKTGHRVRVFPVSVF